MSWINSTKSYIAPKPLSRGIAVCRLSIPHQYTVHIVYKYTYLPYTHLLYTYLLYIIYISEVKIVYTTFYFHFHNLASLFKIWTLSSSIDPIIKCDNWYYNAVYVNDWRYIIATSSRSNYNFTKQIPRICIHKSFPDYSENAILNISRIKFPSNRDIKSIARCLNICILEIRRFWKCRCDSIRRKCEAFLS